MFISSTVVPKAMSSVWNEPVSFVVTNLRPYTTYLFEVSAVTTEAGYIDSAIVRTPESGTYSSGNKVKNGNQYGKHLQLAKLEKMPFRMYPRIIYLPEICFWVCCFLSLYKEWIKFY